MAKTKLNVAMIGYDFMGRTHSNAWRQVARFFADVPFEPVLKVVVGRTEAKLREAQARLGFEERGTLVKGGTADIVVFDPAQIRDRSTDDDPFALSIGMKYVFVNGTMVVKDGELTAERPGVALR